LVQVLHEESGDRTHVNSVATCIAEALST